MASCVAYNKKGILVGDPAHAAYRSEKKGHFLKTLRATLLLNLKGLWVLIKSIRAPLLKRN